MAHGSIEVGSHTFVVLAESILPVYPWDRGTGCQPCLILSPLVGLRGGWGARVMNIKISTMETPKPKTKKRKHSPPHPEATASDDVATASDDVATTSDGVSNNANNDAWPRYLVVTDAADNGTLAKLSPFAIAKGIQGLAGEPKMVKKIKQGLLVEVGSKIHSDLLLRSESIANVPINVSPHRSLNSCRGVIYCAELSNDDEDYILENLRPQNVTAVKRIHVNRGQKATNLYILSFNKPALPKELKVGHLNVKVRLYLPNPLRCYRCQAYGHGSSRCTQNERCSKCGENHSSSVCTSDEPKCLHCHGKHEASDRKCPTFLQEKEIVKVKHTDNISFYEARKKVTSTQGPTYASAAKQKLRSVALQTDPLECLPPLSLWPKNSSQKIQVIRSKDQSQSAAQSPSNAQSQPQDNLSESHSAEQPGSSTVAHTAGSDSKTTPKSTTLQKGPFAGHPGCQTDVPNADSGSTTKGGRRTSPSPSPRTSNKADPPSTEEGMEISSSPPTSHPSGRRGGGNQSNQHRSRSRSVLGRSSVSTVSSTPKK